MWIYKQKEINSLDQFPVGTIGFIYKITNTLNGKIYIGKKALYHSRKTTISKREKATTGTKKRVKIVTKESNWKVYYGSSQSLLNDIEEIGVKHFVREIIEFCHSKKNMTYMEIKYQFKYNVLEIDSYNENIMSRFFKKDL